MPKLAYLENQATLPEARCPKRKILRLDAEGATVSPALTEVVIHHISRSGLLVESGVPVVNGEELDVIIPQFEAVQASVVWNGGPYFVCKFVGQLPTATVPLTPGEAPAMDKGSPEAMSQAAFQLTALSMAVQRLNRVLDRAIDQLAERHRR